MVVQKIKFNHYVLLFLIYFVRTRPQIVNINLYRLLYSLLERDKERALLSVSADELFYGFPFFGRRILVDFHNLLVLDADLNQSHPKLDEQVELLHITDPR